MTAVIYARYSSDKQTAASIDAQVRACREYAAAHDITIKKVYADEAISGKTAQRDKYQRMIRAAARHEFDVILIHQYDRIARNLAEHVNLEIKLKEYAVELISVNQDFGHSKESKIIKPILWALSEYYIDNLAVEVKKGHRETALKALHNGGYPPFGYDVQAQKYVINELEAGFVRKMFQAALDGTGYAALIREMDAAGIKGKRGRPIRYPQIYEILRNEKYTGVYTYTQTEEKDREQRREKANAIRIENALPAIIEKEVWMQVNDAMQARRHVGRNRGKYLCSGLVYCGKCGAKMHASTTRSKGHEYQIYTCPEKCGMGTFRADKIDEAAADYLRKYLDQAMMEDIALLVLRYNAAAKSAAKEFNRMMQKQIAEKQKKYDNLMDTLAAGGLEPPVIQSIGKQMSSLLAEIDALQAAEPPKDYTAQQIMDWLKAVKEAPGDKAMQAFVKRITVQKNPTTIGIETKLAEIVGNLGCGGLIDIIPEILLRYVKRDS